MKLTTIVVLLTLFSSCYAAAFLEAGCPDGRKPGETWNPPGCMECSCRGTTHACYSCGVSSIGINRSLCYVERNETARYPKCCEEKVVCVGDPGFNASKLTKKTTPAKGPQTPQTFQPFPPFAPKGWPALM